MLSKQVTPSTVVTTLGNVDTSIRDAFNLGVKDFIKRLIKADYSI